MTTLVEELRQSAKLANQKEARIRRTAEKKQGTDQAKLAARKYKEGLNLCLETVKSEAEEGYFECKAVVFRNHSKEELETKGRENVCERIVKHLKKEGLSAEWEYGVYDVSQGDTGEEYSGHYINISWEKAKNL
jgi:IS30 family transposase